MTTQEELRQVALPGENESLDRGEPFFVPTGELDKVVFREVLKVRRPASRQLAPVLHDFSNLRSSFGWRSLKRKPDFLRRSPIGALGVVATYGFQ